MTIRIQKILTIQRWKLCLGGFWIFWNIRPVSSYGTLRQIGIIRPYRYGQYGQDVRNPLYVVYSKVLEAID